MKEWNNALLFLHACTLRFNLFPVIIFDLYIYIYILLRSSLSVSSALTRASFRTQLILSPGLSKTRSEVLKSVLPVSLHSADGARTGRPSLPVSAARESAEPGEEERQPAGPSPVIGSPPCALHGSTPTLQIEFLIIYMEPEAQWGPPGETRPSYL